MGYTFAGYLFATRRETVTRFFRKSTRIPSRKQDPQCSKIGTMAATTQANFAGFLAAVLPLLPVTASAHADPWGDIHPKVSEADGKFTVTFESHVHDEHFNSPADGPMFRMIFNTDGSVFSPRQPLNRVRNADEKAITLGYGKSIRVDDATIIIGKDKRKPGYSLESADGKRTEFPLPWPEDVSVVCLDDATATRDGIAMIGKQVPPGEASGEGDTSDPIPLESRVEQLHLPLKFFWFPKDAAKAPVIVEIGPAEAVFHRAVASNIIWAGGRFHVAFMKRERKGERFVATSALWSWKPGEKKGHVELLDSPASADTTMSLGAIGNRLCLAYHAQWHDDAGERGEPGAKIVTVFKKAE